MRYVVKNKDTGHFLRPTGEWTRYLNEAQRFPNGLTLALHLEGSEAAKSNVEVVQLPLI